MFTEANSQQEAGLQDIAIEVLHLLLSHLAQGREQFGVTQEQKEAFIAKLQKGAPNYFVSVSHFLYLHRYNAKLELAFPDIPLRTHEASRIRLISLQTFQLNRSRWYSLPCCIRISRKYQLTNSNPPPSHCQHQR